MANLSLFDSLGRIAGLEATVPALRATLFLFALLGALGWARRRPFLALLVLATGGFLGLGYWLVQIGSPLGFGTDPVLTEDWAQAGVNAGAEPKGAGFVIGTDAGISLVSSLASAGVPFSLVILVPQLAVLLTLGLLVALPLFLLKNRTTAALAAGLALGGGLWPGLAPFGSILLRPSALLAAFAFALMATLLARGPRAGRAFHRFRWPLSAGLIAAAVLDRAVEGSAAPGAAAAFLMGGATIALASPLRAALRSVLGSPTRARRAEALLLFCGFGGSGLLWWDPPSSVKGFNESRGEAVSLLRPMAWITRHVPATSVVLASPAYSAPIAAFAGRRVLFPPLSDGGAPPPVQEPFRRARLGETTRRGEPVARLAEAFSVTHLFLGPGETSPPDVEASGAGEPRLGLVLEYQDVKDFRVFRLVKK